MKYSTFAFQWQHLICLKQHLMLQKMFAAVKIFHFKPQLIGHIHIHTHRLMYGTLMFYLSWDSFIALKLLSHKYCVLVWCGKWPLTVIHCVSSFTVFSVSKILCWSSVKTKTSVTGHFSVWYIVNNRGGFNGVPTRPQRSGPLEASWEDQKITRVTEITAAKYSDFWFDCFA